MCECATPNLTVSVNLKLFRDNSNIFIYQPYSLGPNLVMIHLPLLYPGMKAAILILSALVYLTTSLLQAQVSKTIQVETPGTLSTLLTGDDRATVTDITLSGSINATDFSEMKNTMTVLTAIDLSSVQCEGDSIPGWAFSSNIVSLKLPVTLTRIGNYGLASCSGLTSLVLPESVTSLGAFALAGCSGLSDLFLHQHIDSIGNWAFVSCSGLTTITIAGPISTIGEYTFAGCSKLTSVNLPASVRSIQKFAFASCTGITSLSLPATLDSIAMYAFVSCQKLNALTIPSSVASIGSYAFAGCASLDSLVILPSAGTLINKYAFVGCDSLNSIIIHPSGGTIIEDYAFAGNQRINSIQFHFPSVTSIGDYNFTNCQQLMSLMLPESLVSIGNSCFSNVIELDTLMLPPSLVSIGENSFAGCTGLTSLTIPSSVDTIGAYAFSSCTNMQSIRVNRFIPVEVPLGNLIFSGANTQTCILYVPAGSKEAYASAYRWRDFKNIVEFDLMLSLSHESLTLADTAGSAASFAISSNTEWKVSTDQSWLSVADTMGMDNGTIFLTAEANPAVTERSAVVSITGLGVEPRAIAVTQAPKPSLLFSTDVLRIGAEEGSTVSVDITANISWNLSSDQPWLTASPSSGIGSMIIILTAGANPFATDREATLSLSGERVIPQILAVTQDANITSGIDNLSVPPVRAYPNPVKDLLYIEGAAGNAVSVYNSQGRFLFSCIPEGQPAMIDMSALPAGIYLVQVGSTTLKITK